MIEARGVYLFVGQGSKRTEAFIPIAVQTQQNQYAFSENILTASIKKNRIYVKSIHWYIYVFQSSISLFQISNLIAESSWRT